MPYVITAATYQISTRVLRWRADITTSDGKTTNTGTMKLTADLPLDGDGNPIVDYTPRARAALAAVSKGATAKDSVSTDALRAAMHLDAQRLEAEMEAAVAAPKVVAAPDEIDMMG